MSAGVRCLPAWWCPGTVRIFSPPVGVGQLSLPSDETSAFLVSLQVEGSSGCAVAGSAGG